MPKHIGFRCFLCAAIAIVCVLGARAAQAETLRFIASINDRLTGKAPGYDIEVVRQVLAGMGRDVSFEYFPTNRAWLMIARGERDGMTGVLRTSGRERYCSFSDEPLDRDRSVLFVRTADAGTLKFSSFADLVGHNVAASVTRPAGLFEHAGLSPELAKFLLEHHTLVETNGDTESLRMLAAGRVDYAVMDFLNGNHLIQLTGLSGKIEPLLSHSVIEQDIGVCFTRARVSPSFVGTFSRALKQFKQTEAFQAIYRKYFP